MDSARALQFLRSKSKEWNIDPNKVIVTGFSAGGCSALWLACHADLANPKASDPVERESTRVSGAIVGSAQTTIEPDLVRQWVGPDGVNHPMICNAGGFTNNDDMLKAIADKPDVAALFHEFSPINHLTPDDPPLLLGYTSAEMGSGGIHGGEFGVKFKERAEALGMKNVYLDISRDRDHYSGYQGGSAQFILDIFHLGQSAATK